MDAIAKMRAAFAEMLADEDEFANEGDQPPTEAVCAAVEAIFAALEGHYPDGLRAGHVSAVGDGDAYLGWEYFRPVYCALRLRVLPRAGAQSSAYLYREQQRGLAERAEYTPELLREWLHWLAGIVTAPAIAESAPKPD